MVFWVIEYFEFMCRGNLKTVIIIFLTNYNILTIKSVGFFLILNEIPLLKNPNQKFLN